jgi:hypothetical protein
VLLTSIFFFFESCNKGTTEPIDNTNSQTVKIGADGGTISLGTNVRLVIPSGALKVATDITLTSYKPEQYFDGDVSNYIVVGCEPNGIVFEKNVEIYFFAPSSLDPLKTEGLAGLIDAETNAVEVYPISGLSIDGRTAIKLETTHFSKYTGWFWETLPVESKKIEIPHYNQGSSPYCWAAGIQMLCSATKFDHFREISDVIGNVGVDESGIGQYNFRFNPRVSNEVYIRVGKTPERKIWPYLSASVMNTYLRNKLALGIPVLVYTPVEEHAFIVVGYDGNIFYINDPKSTEHNGKLTMTSKLWKDFKTDEMETNAKFVTLCLTEPPSVTKNLLTVNIGQGELYFNKPNLGFESSKINYSYDYQNRQKGYSFFDYYKNKIDSIQGDVVELNLKNVQISNSSLSENYNLDVRTVVTNKTEQKFYHSETKGVTVNANSMGFYSLSIPIDKFQSLNQNAEYSVSVRLFNGTTMVDEQIIDFILKKPNIKLNIEPNPVLGIVNQELNITAETPGQSITQAKFIWNFGDGSPEVVKYYDNKVTHTYTKPGEFTIKVEMVNNLNNEVLGSTTAIAKITTAVTPFNFNWLLRESTRDWYFDIDFSLSGNLTEKNGNKVEQILAFENNKIVNFSFAKLDSLKIYFNSSFNLRDLNIVSPNDANEVITFSGDPKITWTTQNFVPAANGSSGIGSYETNLCKGSITIKGLMDYQATWFDEVTGTYKTGSGTKEWVLAYLNFDKY